MITQLHIRNFRSIKSADLNLGKITVLTGANNSGKSSFIYALLALKNIVDNPNRSIDNFLTLPFINLGGFEQTVFNKHMGLSIGLGTTIKNDTWEIEYYISLNPGTSQISLSLIKPYVQQYYIDIAFPYPANKNNEYVLKINREEIKFIWNGFTTNVPDKPGTSLLFLKELPFLLPVTTFSDTDFVPIRRGFTQPYYGNVLLQEISTEEQIATLLAIDNDLATKVAFYLEKIVDRRFSVNKIPGISSFQLQTEDKETGFISELVNEGLGTNQLVTILAKVLQKDNKFICIDEPEIHLHPSIIDKLVSVLIEIAEKDGKQFLVSTHSEHFITSLLTSVVKKEISNEDIKVYYLSKDGKETKAELQAINTNGQIDGGLKNFYDAELNNLKVLFKITE